MDEPDLATWLRDWRWRTRPTDDAHAIGAMAMAPLSLLVDTHWVTLSATAEPQVLRLDVLLDPLLQPPIAVWLCEQLLRWSFEHLYPDEGLQFGLTPDGTLLASSHLWLEPDSEEEDLRALIEASVDQADEAWTLLMADALLQAYRVQTAAAPGAVETAVN